MGAAAREPLADLATQRLDKWLWAARFFKTRSLAARAVTGGKVHVNGARAKPAKLITAATELEIRRGETVWRVVVRGLSKQRRPAREAGRLYAETAESATARAAAARRRRERESRTLGLGRPTKRDRRLLGYLTGR